MRFFFSRPNHLCVQRREAESALASFDCSLPLRQKSFCLCKYVREETGAVFGWCFTFALWCGAEIRAPVHGATINLHFTTRKVQHPNYNRTDFFTGRTKSVFGLEFCVKGEKRSPAIAVFHNLLSTWLEAVLIFEQRTPSTCHVSGVL